MDIRAFKLTDGRKGIVQEFKKMPLRLSRQMLLDQWNEAIAFVSSTIYARLASGKRDAGMVLKGNDISSMHIPGFQMHIPKNV